MDALKFYRVRSWIKNLGIVLLGFLSSDGSLPDLFLSFLNTSFLMAFVASLNDFYDSRSGEKNFVGEFVEEHGERKALFLVYCPLIGVMLLHLLRPSPNLLLVSIAFAFLYYVYSAPPRLRNWWYFSLPINVVCLGPLTFFQGFYPGSGEMNYVSIGVVLSLSIYIALSETIHQMSHEKKDREMKVRSLPNVFGLRASKNLAKFFCGLGIVINVLFSFAHILFLCASVVWVLRFVKVSSARNYGKLREEISFVPDGILFSLALASERFL
ncbi:MAG TPA: hypothetical protein ENF51_00650 [Candidatus Aenigmarchaeota archaeon]|nr:hypothetical protein [Candidatus Aenigmarchaeota archaeon]